MSGDERTWLEEAIGQCRAASTAGVTILLTRFQDANDEADIVVTNAASPEMAQALAIIYHNKREAEAED